MDPFDFNNNGKLDAFDFMILDEIMNDDENEDKLEDDLTDELDPDELKKDNE